MKTEYCLCTIGLYSFPGTVVLTVAASDADRTATNNQVTHSITGTGDKFIDLQQKLLNACIQRYYPLRRG